MYKISYLNVKDLIPYVNNSRTHSDDQVNQIASSINEFGFTNPILIDDKQNIIAGHGRVLAANKLDLDKVPTIELKGLTKAQIKAYVIADNQLALNAGWDLDVLKLELKHLQEIEFDLDLLGFDDDFIGGLLEEEPNEGLTDEDAVPEAPEEPITKLGDVWILGNHRLMCGSSTDEHSVASLLDGQSPNTMVTDPPYGVNYEAGWRAKAKCVKATEREQSSSLQNDDKSDWYDAYALFPGNVAYVWHASAFTDVVMDGLRRAAFEVKQQIIWNKNVHALSRSDYHWKHEPCWYAVRGGERNWKGGRKQMTVWDIKSVIFEETKTSHPTQKPVEIFTRAIEHHTNQGEYVYEPFAGSGTAIIACEKLGRRSLSMELDPKYCDVIVRRWMQYTGKMAILESTGDKFEEAA